MQRFAADFVDSHSGYDLDYSVESLSDVDAIFDEKFRTDQFADAELGKTDDEASIVLTATASEAGGYLGEVFRRNTDAEWQYRDGDGLKIEFPARDADIRVDPMATVASAIEDDESVAESYRELVSAVEEVESELDDLES
jgi:broad specificity phosphatase PhoE